MNRLWAIQFEHFNDQLDKLVSDKEQPKCWEERPWDTSRPLRQRSSTPKERIQHSKAEEDAWKESLNAAIQAEWGKILAQEEEEALTVNAVLTPLQDKGPEEEEAEGCSSTSSGTSLLAEDEMVVVAPPPSPVVTHTVVPSFQTAGPKAFAQFRELRAQLLPIPIPIQEGEEETGRVGSKRGVDSGVGVGGRRRDSGYASGGGGPGRGGRGRGGSPRGRRRGGGMVGSNGGSGSGGPTNHNIKYVCDRCEALGF